MLEQNNITAIHLPLFTFQDGNELDQLNEQLKNLQPQDWVFPVSIQAIEFANKQLKNLQLTWPKHLNYLAVGKKSAEKLATVTQHKIIYPAHNESSEGLLDIFNEKDLNHKKFLILRAESGRELLSDYLRHRGTEVKTLCCYTRKEIHYHDIDKLHQLKPPYIFIVTSQTNLMALEKLLRNNHFSYKNGILVTISTRLALMAQERGWKNIHICKKVNNQFLYNTVQSITKSLKI